MSTETIEGTAEEVGEGVGTAVVHQPALAVTPQVKASELVERLNVIRDAADHAMKEGVDFGKVPGTDKPTLLKPGAEKLSVLFQLDVQLHNETIWGPGEHLTVVSHATVYHAPTGSRLGYGEGICTTRERKYAYRQADRVCPHCGKPAIIKGKAEYGGGWLCFRKKDGCGAKFEDADPAIVGQQVGQVENPDLPDLWNTVVKMAEKRARVDAVLAVTGASALFTQDMEDQPAREPDPTPAAGANGASGDPTDSMVDDNGLKQLRVLYKESGLDAEGLRLRLVSVGAQDVQDVRKAMKQLTVHQAGVLFNLLSEEAHRRG